MNSRASAIENPTTVTTRINGLGLATDLFGQPVGLDQDYLKTPSGLLCARGTLVDRKCNRLIPQRCKLRSCPHCRLVMAWRRLRQVQYEEITHWARVEEGKWQACRKYHSRHQAPYLAFPQGEVVMVISSLGENNLPDDEAEMAKLIDTWLASIPKGKRVRPSCKFGGGQWAGARAKTEKGRYVHIGRDVELIVAGVKAELTRQAKAIHASEQGLHPDYEGVYHTTSDVVALALALNKKMSV